MPEREQKYDIVREDDDLPRFRLLHQPLRHRVAPLKIQRGHRIVEHDAGGIVGCAEFSEERGDGKTPLFAFTNYFWQLDTGRARENQFVIKNAIRTAKLFQFDLDMTE